MEIKNRQQVLIIAAIAIIVLFVGDKLFFTPLMAAWNTRSEEVKHLRQQLTEGKALLKREQDVRGRWTEMQRNTLTNNTSAAEHKFWRTMYDCAQNSGATVAGLAPQWRHDSDDYMSYQCRVDVSGNLSTLSQFLYNLEKDPMALKFESLELSARDKEGQQLSLGLQVSALVLTPQTR